MEQTPLTIEAVCALPDEELADAIHDLEALHRAAQNEFISRRRKDGLAKVKGTNVTANIRLVYKIDLEKNEHR